MNSSFLGQLRESLLEKRQNIGHWLLATPAHERQVRLGPDGEQGVQAHLHVLETTLDRSGDDSFGVCVVCHGYIETERLEMDYTATVCFDCLSDMERSSLEYELELSKTVQRGFLPQDVPDMPGLEVAAFSRPAQIVGGDSFDFVQFGDGAHGIAIADVAGKGMSASLLMASLQTAMRTLAPLSESPADVVQQINRLFCHNIHFTTFVTLFLAAFDPGSRTLVYCNAGHNPPLIFHDHNGAGEPVAWLGPTGAAIGLVEEAEFGLEMVRLSPGDVLLLYTDGVTETINRRQELFGQARLAELVREASDSSARDLVRTLRQALEEFAEGQQPADDTTIIACKIA